MDSSRQMRNGFTLMEILVVVMIMAVLATIVGVNVIPALGDARRKTAETQIASFRTALNVYRLDNHAYPTQEQGLAALCRRPEIEPMPPAYRQEGYLDSSRVPDDPWGNPYVYLNPGPDGAPYEIISYGADGRPGGEKDDADISSANL